MHSLHSFPFLTGLVLCAIILVGAAASSQALEHDTNRPGGDYANFDLFSPDPDLCRQACLGDPTCKSFTYVKPGIQGANARCWLKNTVPSPVPDPCCVSGTPSPAQTAAGLEQNTNRPGKDYNNFDLAAADPNLCRQACLNDPNCRAFTYVKPGVQGPNPRCWLKDDVPPAQADNCCVSGVSDTMPDMTGLEMDTDRFGSDYHSFDMTASDPQLCRQACLNDPNCRAFTYVKPGVQGPNPRCYLKSPAPGPAPDNCCISGKGNEAPLEQNTDRMGMDYHGFDLFAADPELCRQACQGDPTCKAFTYVKPGIQGPNPRCYLKNGVPNPTPDNCCISGLP